MRAGVMDTKTGNLLHQSEVIGPLLGETSMVDNLHVWSVADGDNLVLTWAIGPGDVTTATYVWFAFTQNLTSIYSGPTNIPANTTMALFFDVASDSAAVIASTPDRLCTKDLSKMIADN
jgi:hypothetical protein